jgi:hypothetical protein
MVRRSVARLTRVASCLSPAVFEIFPIPAPLLGRKTFRNDEGRHPVNLRFFLSYLKSPRKKVLQQVDGTSDDGQGCGEV